MTFCLGTPCISLLTYLLTYLQQLVILIYCWSRDMSQKDMIHEANIDERTAVDWCSFLREECEIWLMLTHLEN